METLIFLHSYLAYAVLLILILAVSNALKGWLTNTISHTTLIGFGCLFYIG
jgi:hypothetical protein